MGKIQNQDLSQFDRFTKDQWTQFLKDGAYRGAKINKVAKRVESKRFSDLIKDHKQITLTRDGSKPITIKLKKLLKKHDDWTLSRLIHNINMSLSSDYAEDFNDRIEKFADELIKSGQRSGFSKTLNDFVNVPNHSQDDIETFFKTNQRFIDGSTGDQQIQADLFKLSSLAKDPNLAHLIYSKATAVMPLPAHMDFGILPADVQGLIFSEIGATESLNPLLVSKKISKDVYSVKNKWINDNDVCLRTLGCKTAKEAVKYVLDHQLTSANLAAFDDFNDEDLEKLGKCTELKKLSLNSHEFAGDKLVDKLKKFSNLENLNLGIHIRFDSDLFAEILEKHTTLQGIGIPKVLFTDRIVKALVNQTNLQRLTLRGISPDQLAEILEKHTNLQRIDLSDESFNDRVLKAFANLTDLDDFKLQNSMSAQNDRIVEILEKHTNLKGLWLFCVGNNVLKAIVNLNSLHCLTLAGHNYSDNEVADILEKHTELQSLELITNGGFGQGLFIKKILHRL